MVSGDPEPAPVAGPPSRQHYRVARHVWVAILFVFLWLHLSYVRPHLRFLDWPIYSLYFLSVAAVALRYVAGLKYGADQKHRILFDGLSILLIALGVRLTGGIASDLWLVFFVLVIAETLDAGDRTFLWMAGAVATSYVLATWPDEVSRGYLEALGTRLFFLVLVASLARVAAIQDRERLADLAALRETLSVSEERRRLARDLHDGLGHTLTRVILHLEVARREYAADPAAGAEAVGQQAAALRGAMAEMRQIVATLRADTAVFDLPATLRRMVGELSGSLAVTLQLPEASLPLSALRQYHLARIIQEALTNCLRHSGAGRAAVEVRIATDPQRVVATVGDEGCGFDLASARGESGHGLRGMEERLAPYGGKVSVDTAPGRGTRLTAELPADLEG